MKAKQLTHCIVCNIRLNKLEQEIGLCYDCEQEDLELDKFFDGDRETGFYDDDEY